MAHGFKSVSDSVLTARSLEAASDSVSSSLSAPPPLVLARFRALSLSLKNKQTLNKIFNVKNPDQDFWNKMSNSLLYCIVHTKMVFYEKHYDYIPFRSLRIFSSTACIGLIACN